VPAARVLHYVQAVARRARLFEGDNRGEALMAWNFRPPDVHAVAGAIRSVEPGIGVTPTTYRHMAEAAIDSLHVHEMQRDLRECEGRIARLENMLTEAGIEKPEWVVQLGIKQEHY
jgi:hypothetical protein